MKKIFALCLTFCFVLTLAGCGDSKTSSSGADSTPAASTESKVESNTESKTESSNESKTGINDDIYYKSYPENPYAPHEIIYAEITTTETEKTIKTGFFTINVPLDWKCSEINGEDGSYYHFSHPTLGDNCKVMFEITLSDYKRDRTQEEYLEDYKYAPDMKVESFTAEKFDGIDCSKMVSTYTDDGTKFVRIDYFEAVRGHFLYNVTTIRPAKNEEFESVLDDIVKSLKFPAKG